jgi:hypothetical protein
VRWKTYLHPCFTHKKGYATCCVYWDYFCFATGVAIVRLWLQTGRRLPLLWRLVKCCMNGWKTISSLSLLSPLSLSQY